jgi:hypothetical protein
MTTVINFKEQIILTIQERSNAPFHSGCKMFNWSSNDNPIKVELILYFKKNYFEFYRIFRQLNLIMNIQLFYLLKLNNTLKVNKFQEKTFLHIYLKHIRPLRQKAIADFRFKIFNK